MEGRCPVCGVAFRATRFCSRCGADLGPLMRLAVHAAQLRRSVVSVFSEGDCRRAADLAARAQRIHATPAGRKLSLLAAWLAEGAAKNCGDAPG